MRRYGMTCHGCGESFDIDVEEAEDPVLTSRRVEMAAGLLGWVVGHWDGQGEYRCAGCANSIWDPIPLFPLGFQEELERLVWCRVAADLEALGEEDLYGRLSTNAEVLWSAEDVRALSAEFRGIEEARREAST